MDPAIAGLIGASIGAVASLLGSLLSNLIMTRNERDKWVRTQETEREKWLRDRLQEIYSSCIHHLSMLLGRRSEITAEGGAVLSKDDVGEWFNDYSEAQKWLALLLIYYPERDTPVFEAFRDAVVAFSKGDLPDLKIAKALRDFIIEAAAKDSRLQVTTCRQMSIQSKLKE